MSERLVVVINDVSQLEYDRSRPLAAAQLQYLERMDRRMDEGIQLGLDYINEPNQLQRAQFIAVTLVNAIGKQDEALAAATCAYLAQRMPELRQVKVAGVTPEQTIDLVFDKDYVKAQPIQFVKPGDLNL